MISYVPVTIVDGTTYTGLYAADGSYNIVDRTSDTAEWLGVLHPCGALNVVAVDGSTYVGLYAENGAINAIEGTIPGQLLHPSGALQINQGIGTLTLSADTAYYTLTYPDVNLLTPLSANFASYTYTPQDVSFRVDRVLIADNPSYTYSPQDIGVSRDYTLAAEYAAYTYTAQDAALLALGLFEHATYTYTPQDVTFLYDRVLAADNAAYTYSPQDVYLPLGLLYEHASYTFSPQDITMTRSYHLAAANASYTLSPQAATLTYTAGGPDYTENSFDPPVVADFAGVLNSGTEYYRVGGSDSTFDSMFTFSRAGNATMVDSDGNLKWAPHNLMLYSDFASGWTATNVSQSTGQTDPDSGTDANLLTASAGTSGHYLQRTFSSIAGPQYTIEVVAKAGTTNYFYLGYNGPGPQLLAKYVVDLSDGSIAQTITAGDDTPTVTSLGGGWYSIAVRDTATGSAGLPAMRFGPHDGTASESWTAAGTETVTVAFPRSYRSDLGGMVDNPDRGDSYVPTTTAAVYQARRNHYRYNGSTYDNKGILLESEARTNLITNSDLTGFSDTNITRTTGQTNSLTGQSDAVLLTVGTASNSFTFFDHASTATQTLSVLAKAGTNNFIRLTHLNVATCNAYYNLTTGAVTDTGGTSFVDAYTEEMGDGWWRCVCVTNYGGNSSSDFVIGVPAASGNTTGSAGATVYVAYPQAEEGSTPSSIIPTSGATVTRAAETLDIPFANMPSLATAFCVQMQGEVRYADNGVNPETAFFDWYQTSANNIRAYLRTLTTRDGEYQLEYDGGGATQFAPGGEDALTPGLAEPYNFAMRGTATARNVASDGVADTEITTTSAMPSITSAAFEIGELNNVHYYNGTVGMIRMWDDDIGDTGIESATS